MPAPYPLTCPLRSPDLAQQTAELGMFYCLSRSLGDVCDSLTVGPTGAARSGAPANFAAPAAR
jgi:hypothetical protein